ncbi:hypothetical protein [Dyadobacter arcticus]|uniref:Uncharacterized protein n=1 Tax=Dyadobacter arcticus TaxID=1078754 RepID=A0ABX0UPQ7_9BACT|nr:hypothetical protein [Dyadobacter arcticus]NIJ54964.1 hypothetical protein [Dyadobacter arcticus]
MKYLSTKLFKGKFIPLVYLCILVVQFILHRYIIIYPSLVFPGFTGAPKIDKEAIIPVVNLYAISGNGQRMKLDKKDFFSNLYYKHVNYFLNVILENEKNYKNNPKLYSRRRDFIYFAQRQLRLMDPSKEFKVLLIEKGDMTYNTIEDKMKPELTNVKSVFISLP